MGDARSGAELATRRVVGGCNEAEWAGRSARRKGRAEERQERDPRLKKIGMMARRALGEQRHRAARGGGGSDACRQSNECTSGETASETETETDGGIRVSAGRWFLGPRRHEQRRARAERRGSR